MKASEFHCTVKAHRMLTSSVFELTFDTEQPLEFQAGQFISVVVPGAGPHGRDLRRAYSIASAPHVRPIELCVKVVEEGPGSGYLNTLRPGDKFRGWAPYGDFLYAAKPGRHALFIATGTGIAPFRSMVDSAGYQACPPVSATCLLGVRSEDELLYQDSMTKVPALKWVPIVSRPQGAWSGLKGRVTDYLRSLDSSFPWLSTDFYLCGNGEMITEVKSILTEKGVQKESIHGEKYY